MHTLACTKGYSHTVFFPPSISRPHQTNPPNRLPAIHLQSTAVDTQESRHTHTRTHSCSFSLLGRKDSLLNQTTACASLLFLCWQVLEIKP